MQVIYPRCAGLDVHKKSVVACVLLTHPDGAVERQVRTFGTMTRDLLALGDWLTQLLGHPRVGGVARDADMHHPARAQRDDEEAVERAEEQVGDREEVARPDVVRVVAQESGLWHTSCGGG